MCVVDVIVVSPSIPYTVGVEIKVDTLYLCDGKFFRLHSVFASFLPYCFVSLSFHRFNLFPFAVRTPKLVGREATVQSTVHEKDYTLTP